MKFSIIVPVYNVERYVRQCIESILSQTYDSYELLIIDDGSTDGSGKICDSFSGLPQVKVFHRKNYGVSNARNFGIRKAVGDYIMFIDSDDYLFSQDCLAKLAYVLKTEKPDVLQYKFIYYYERKKSYHFVDDIICNNDDILFNKFFVMIRNSTLSAGCDKIIRRSIITDNDIFFNENILSEDLDFSLCLYQHINSLTITNTDVYVYRQQRNGSTTNGVSRKRVKSLWYVINKWCSYNYSAEETKKMFLSYLAYQYLILLSIVGRNNSTKEEIKKYKSIIGILKNDLNYKVRKFNKISSIFGIRAGIISIKVYLFLKNKGAVRL
ncbi:glycosyltransferase family 2 protein [Candidatus Saccharibacteria bacterium]|nr:glycosyltransferase family 2 protein [Candidatus Saccharibacteria bacterium]